MVITFDELTNQITIAPTDASHMGTTEILIMVNDSEGYVMEYYELYVEIVEPCDNY